MAEELQFRMRILPTIEGLDDAMSAIGKYVDNVGTKSVNSILGTLHQATGGVSSRALAGGIAGGRFGQAVASHTQSGVAPSAAPTLGRVGGFIGGIAGGPAGGAVGGVAGSLVGGGIDLVGRGLGTVARGMVGAVGTVESSLKELQGSLGPVGLGFNAVSGAMKGVSSVVKSIPVVGALLGPMVDALSALPGVLKGVTESLVGMAAKADPGIFHQWQIALDDTQGVIGQTFVPVLDLMKDGVRLFADVLASILPNQQEVSEALTDLRETFSEVSAGIREAMREIGPVIRGGIVTAIKALATVAGWAAKAVGSLVSAIQWLLRATGLSRGEAAKEAPRTSWGAAARPAHIGGVEDYGRHLQEQFFSLSSSGMRGKTHQEQMVEHLAAIRMSNEAILGVDREATSRVVNRGDPEVTSGDEHARNMAADVATIARSLRRREGDGSTRSVMEGTGRAFREGGGYA